MGTSQTDLDLPLVQALQAGDESALNKLIRKYQKPLFWFIWRYTGDEETTRDLLQETFVRLYFGIRRFKPHAKFATWLYSIAMNLCRDYARSKQRRQSCVTESLDAGDLHREVADRGADANVESHERLEALEKAIKKLPHDLRTALLLFAVERPLAAGVRGASRRQREGGGGPRLSRAQAFGEHTAWQHVN
jgi:RNA polymerase sigma factor (sigma-70 family)